DVEERRFAAPRVGGPEIEIAQTPEAQPVRVYRVELDENTPGAPGRAHAQAGAAVFDEIRWRPFSRCEQRFQVDVEREHRKGPSVDERLLPRQLELEPTPSTAIARGERVEEQRVPRPI